EGFDEVRFDALGLRPRKWKLPVSQRLAVISPFCSAEALKTLAASSADPALLISRPEELDKLNGSAHQLFKQCMVLRDAAESEDGEDTTGQPGTLRGLHAKVYVGQHGWDT
ncbi:MAG: phospholipase D family protein, partial [Acidobacteria bacterium]|nr:phospholipase D family protein [Acidobacteriota bacterium]